MNNVLTKNNYSRHLVSVRYLNVLKPVVFVCRVIMVNANTHEHWKENKFLRESPLPQNPLLSLHSTKMDRASFGIRHSL